jgi:hypothetical protein
LSYLYPIGNDKSLDLSILAPGGDETPLGRGIPNQGVYVNMDSTLAVPGDYSITAKNASGAADKILIIIGSKPQD